MQHFYQQIHGWFDFDDIYRAAVELAPDGRDSLFVELGSWVGQSAAFMAVEIVNSGKAIRFDCVDSWEGTGKPGEYAGHADMIEQGLYDLFVGNMKPVEGHYCPQRGLTTDVAGRYAPESIDFLFIDAGHAYDAIHADLVAWLPKVRPGGWVGGHDFFNAPDGVGRAVRELVPDYRTSRSSWFARMGPGGPEDMERRLGKA